MRRRSQLVPHVRTIAYNSNDPPTYRALRRRTVNIGVMLSADFSEASYEMDGKKYSAAIPALACITPGSLFRQCNPGTCEKLYFTYHAEELERFASFQRKPEDFIVNIKNVQRLKEILAAIFRLCREIRLPGNADRLDFCCAELLNEAVLNAPAQNSDNMPREQSVLQIASALDMHFSEKTDFEELALRHGMSLRTFMRIWQKEFHISPHAYILRRQMEEARRLLAETELKIYQVAEQTGFADPYYFSRCFKSKTGLSPNEYRRKKWKNQ